MKVSCESTRIMAHEECHDVDVKLKLRGGIDDPKRGDDALSRYDDSMRKICDSSPHQSMRAEKCMTRQKNM